MFCLQSLGSGMAGACALTVAHQLLQGATSRAPRMDILGMRALAGTFRAAGAEPPGEGALYPMTLAGDLASNACYYSLVGIGGPETACARGALLGLLAGIGAVTLPGPMGLGTNPSSRTTTTALLTVGLYLLGGLVAGCVSQQLEKSSSF